MAVAALNRRQHEQEGQSKEVVESADSAEGEESKMVPVMLEEEQWAPWRSPSPEMLQAIDAAPVSPPSPSPIDAARSAESHLRPRPRPRAHSPSPSPSPPHTPPPAKRHKHQVHFNPLLSFDDRSSPRPLSDSEEGKVVRRLDGRPRKKKGKGKGRRKTVKMGGGG